MLQQWLSTHQINEIDFSAPLFPAGSDRAFWEACADPRHIAAAETLLGYDWPTIKATDYLAFYKDGSRKMQENPHFARRGALITLVAAELFEYQGRFLPDIINGLFAICEESFWGISAHLRHCTDRKLPNTKENYVDLFAAETASALALTCTLLKEPLQEICPELIERIQLMLEERVRKPYLAANDWRWMPNARKSVNNWVPWILSNLLSVFLLTEPDPAVRAEGIAKMFRENNSFYSQYPDDGGCDEGTTYWAYSGGALFDFTEQLYRATNGAINFFGDEKLRRIGAFPHRLYIGDGQFVNFADGTGRYSSTESGLLYLFGRRIEDPCLIQLAKEIAGQKVPFRVHNNGSLRRELYRCIYAKEIADQDTQSIQSNCLLPDLQVAVIQKGGWFAAIKGGNNNERHNHNDVGSFVAYHNKKPVLVDPGVGTYTKKTFSRERYTIPTMQSAFHNLPLINGQMQRDGAEYRADSFGLEGDTASVSFAGAYPPSANVQSLHRVLTLTAEGLRITDTFERIGSGSVCEHFITPLPIRIEGDTAILDERFALTVAGATLSADLLDFEGDTQLIERWDVQGLNRLKFQTEQSKITISLKEICNE